MKKILVVNGPNLDILGKREVDLYGENTLDDINTDLKKLAGENGIETVFFQSSHEGDIVNSINQTDADAIIINPAAYTHTSVAIHDALRAKNIPSVEVHISNIYAREEFRHKSLIAPVVSGQISGFGRNSYLLALKAVIDLMK